MGTGWRLGPPMWQRTPDGRCWRIDRPVGWAYHRLLWIWTVRIRHRAKYRGVF